MKNHLRSRIAIICVICMTLSGTCTVSAKPSESKGKVISKSDGVIQFVDDDSSDKTGTGKTITKSAAQSDVPKSDDIQPADADAVQSSDNDGDAASGGLMMPSAEAYVVP